MSVVAEALGKEFPAGEGRNLTVLSAVDLTVARGESLAVMGPSGSGKSTLLGLLAGLDDPSHGRVVVDDQDLAALRPDALAGFRGRTMGFVFQSYRLLPALTALENVQVPLELAGVKDADERAAAMLDRVGLRGRRDHVPARLSGGEQQRVALARALVCAPAVVLADEPTGNLDSHTGAEMADLLFDLVCDHRAALVYATHDPQLAARADRVLHLRDGRPCPGDEAP